MENAQIKMNFDRLYYYLHAVAKQLKELKEKGNSVYCELESPVYDVVLDKIKNHLIDQDKVISQQRDMILELQQMVTLVYNELNMKIGASFFENKEN